jgi:hypothetical protein
MDGGKKEGDEDRTERVFAFSRVNILNNLVDVSENFVGCLDFFAS